MMQKEAKPQDVELNRVKAETDAKVGELLKMDKEGIDAKAAEIADVIKKEHGVNSRVVVTGGAGSGKTTLTAALAKALGSKGLSFDEYIPGGWIDDKEEYARRFSKGLYEMWEDVPPKKGWVIEHVESCNENLVGLYRPDFAVLVDPGDEHLGRVVEARSSLQGSITLSRALQSAEKAKTQFNALPGSVLLKVPGFVLKSVEG